MKGDWEFAETPFPGWGDALRALGAGFFHSPPGLEVGAPAGTPMYARYLDDGRLLGVALGVRVGCRLSTRRLHAYFPSWPAFAAAADRGHGIARLESALRAEGLAEVAWDSFDAWRSTPITLTPARCEYLLPLDRVGSTGEWVAEGQHRRNVRRGDRGGLMLHRLAGAAAAAALNAVLTEASARAAQRGVRFLVEVPAIVARDGATNGAWGLDTFAAFRGATLLAALLIGRGPERAYYVLGGATPEGYQIGASIWLHAKVAERCAADGLREYNLGGAPASATDPADPSHGLHRFKQGFGARMVPCAGDRWVFGSVHLAGHRVARWAAGMVR